LTLTQLPAKLYRHYLKKPTMNASSKITALSILAFCMAFSSCSKEPVNREEEIDLLAFDTITLEPSMKGWELYSWPDRNNYSHSLLPGTNRLKTYDEVISNKYVVFGTDSLKMLLARLPENENIFWIGRDWLERCWGVQPFEDLVLPVPLIVKEIEEFCKERGLELSVSEN